VPSARKKPVKRPPAAPAPDHRRRSGRNAPGALSAVSLKGSDEPPRDFRFLAEIA